MDGLREFLDDLMRHGYARGNFLGLLNVLIGRRLQTADGTLLSSGLTWRSLAELLKKARCDRQAVRDLGLNPVDLPPRDRIRFWYLAISQAQVDSAAASQAGDRLAEVLRAAGFLVGPSPQVGS